MFNVKENTELLVQWIEDWFSRNGGDCNAVIGISGGKDSTICAALLSEALGSSRVIGVLMPNGVQSDIEDSRRVIQTLGIRSYTINIEKAFGGIVSEFKNEKIEVNSQFRTNTPARLRMAVLYGVASAFSGRVCNTTNLSEAYVGYGTLFGDTAGDFSPLGKLTKSEVVQIGDYLARLPEDLVHKAPSDGMSGKTDEDNLGVSYDDIDKAIREGVRNERVEELHRKSQFKRELIRIPTFEPVLG